MSQCHLLLRLRVGGTYLVYLTMGSLVWETAQMPLYTLWSQGTSAAITKDVLICTANDLAIGGSCLAFALWFSGGSDWPHGRYRECAALTCLLGVAYTAFSEWLNVHVLGTWTYSALMPVLPVVDLGVSPLLQWLALPWLALALARPRAA